MPFVGRDSQFALLGREPALRRLALLEVGSERPAKIFLVELLSNQESVTRVNWKILKEKEDSSLNLGDSIHFNPPKRCIIAALQSILPCMR